MDISSWQPPRLGVLLSEDLRSIRVRPRANCHAQEATPENAPEIKLHGNKSARNILMETTLMLFYL